MNKAEAVDDDHTNEGSTLTEDELYEKVLLLLRDLDYPSTQSIPADMYYSALVRAFLHEGIRLALAGFGKTGAQKALQRMTEMLDGDDDWPPAFREAAWHFEEQSGNLELEEMENNKTASARCGNQLPNER